MLKKVLGFLVLLIIAAVAFVATRPNTFHVERSVTINAPADAVFAPIDNLHEFPKWSPWQDIDPAMKISYDGPETGVGAGYAWEGNDKVGSGRMTITESIPGEKVGIKLEFFKPFKAENQTALVLAPDGAGTRVTWSIDGPMQFITKAMCLFTPMDKMMGPDFEKGLGKLKTLAEASAASGMPADGTMPADTTAVPATP